MNYRSNLSAIIILLHFYFCFSASAQQSENDKTIHLASALQSKSSEKIKNHQISLLSPFGGEYFLKESNINISWDTALKDKIEIEFSPDG